MLPFFAWKIFSISFFISLDFYLQVLLIFCCSAKAVLVTLYATEFALLGVVSQLCHTDRPIANKPRFATSIT